MKLKLKIYVPVEVVIPEKDIPELFRQINERMGTENESVGTFDIAIQMMLNGDIDDEGSDIIVVPDDEFSFEDIQEISKYIRKFAARRKAR